MNTSDLDVYVNKYGIHVTLQVGELHLRVGFNFADHAISVSGNIDTELNLNTADRPQTESQK